MRQVLGASKGVVVARSPKPALQTGSVLVRVKYSMISIGTEVAGLMPPDETPKGNIEIVKEKAEDGARKVGKAIADPKRAFRYLKNKVDARTARKKALQAEAEVKPVLDGAKVTWTQNAASEFSFENGVLNLTTDDSPALYQADASPIPVPEGYIPEISIKGAMLSGMAVFGFLSEDKSNWLETATFASGELDECLLVDPGNNKSVNLVIANAGTLEPSKIILESVTVRLVPRKEGGLPPSEMGQVGWNLGYAAAGEVIEVAEGVEGFAPGDLVACSGAGQANHADFICVKQNMVAKLPAGADLRDACSTTIGVIALQGVRRADPLLGDKICVLGLGLIGQITVQLLVANGCRVIGFDPDPERVARAIEFGMEAGGSNPDEFLMQIRNFTGNQGVDRTIITAATKSNVVINTAMQVTRRKGVVVIVGDIGLDVKRGDFYKKEIDLLMSSSYGPGRYDRNYEEFGQDYPYAYVRWTMNRNMEAYLDLLAKKKIVIGPMIDVEGEVDDAPAVYGALMDKEAEKKPLAAVLRYDNEKIEPYHDDPTIILQGHRKFKPNKINYALVGAGAFGQSMLVPNLAKSGDKFFLRGVVSRDAIRGGNFARQNSCSLFASNIDGALQSDEIDMVVIATRHNEHAEQTVAAIKAGKHVFVEKPIALSWDELGKVETAYNACPNDKKPIVMVGFNRRFSPALQRIAKELASRQGPIMVNYRLNGGYIPKESWIQDEQGGGRNIGEACHMYDCFRFLARSPVKDISAHAIATANTPYMKNDNFVATLTYEDGSVCNLIYTAVGPKKGMPKERIEVFADGDAYVVDDFKVLTKASANVKKEGDKEIIKEAPIWQSSDPDKGHAEEMRQLAQSFENGTEAPIPFDEIIETSAVALTIEDLLFNRVNND